MPVPANKIRSPAVMSTALVSAKSKMLPAVATTATWALLTDNSPRTMSPVVAS